VLGRIAYQNKPIVYGLLLKAAAETLAVIAADPKYLGADIGIMTVLHTWGQQWNGARMMTRILMHLKMSDLRARAAAAACRSSRASGDRSPVLSRHAGRTPRNQAFRELLDCTLVLQIASTHLATIMHVQFSNTILHFGWMAIER